MENQILISHLIKACAKQKANYHLLLLYTIQPCVSTFNLMSSSAVTVGSVHAPLESCNVGTKVKGKQCSPWSDCPWTSLFLSDFHRFKIDKMKTYNLQITTCKVVLLLEKLYLYSFQIQKTLRFFMYFCCLTEDALDVFNIQ